MHLKKLLTSVILTILTAAVLTAGTLYTPAAALQAAYSGDGNAENGLSQQEPEQDCYALQGFVFLVFGLDGEEGQDGGRSDTIMICTLDRANQKIKLASILRDTKVQVEGYGEQKINTAYKFGGSALALSTIRENFLLDIPDYITVDFQTLKDLVDILGGIDIELTTEEAQVLNNEGAGPAYEGLNTLNGQQALAYTRIRNIDSDVVRAGRQQTVIAQMFVKLREGNVLQWLKVIYRVLTSVEISIGLGDLLQLLSMNLSEYDVENTIVPDGIYEEDVWSGIDENGQWVFEYDTKAAGKRIADFINAP